MLQTLHATRYVTPLREGGSLPAIVEAEDDGLYVLKFTAAGQGVKALNAEIIGGSLAMALGLRTPEIVLMEVDPVLGRSEPDYEIRQLLTASAGLNLAFDYLPGSISFDPVANKNIDPVLASKIVWFDSFITNVDRTARNTNMLMWHKNLWLIDHGAALFFHHRWDGYLDRAANPFVQVKDHVLLPMASKLVEADQLFRPMLTEAVLRSAVDLIPAEWLPSVEPFGTSDEHREGYVQYLTSRLLFADHFLQEALDARAKLV